jgi:hypothetical protein
MKQIEAEAILLEVIIILVKGMDQRGVVLEVVLIPIQQEGIDKEEASL